MGRKGPSRNGTGNGTGPIGLAGHGSVMTREILANDSMAGPSKVCGMSVVGQCKFSGRSVLAQWQVSGRSMCGL